MDFCECFGGKMSWAIEVYSFWRDLDPDLGSGYISKYGCHMGFFSFLFFLQEHTVCYSGIDWIWTNFKQLHTCICKEVFHVYVLKLLAVVFELYFNLRQTNALYLVLFLTFNLGIFWSFNYIV